MLHGNYLKNAKMRKIPTTLLWSLFLWSILQTNCFAASVKYDKQIPQLAFAAEELELALQESGRKNLKVTLTIKADESKPEAFQIRSSGPKRVEVTGTDAKGAMYGGLEVAELLRLGLPIEDKDQEPFVEKRGIKWNIPLDARIPSYDDSGDAAQKNIETVWDFEFWKAYLDDLARYRYNVLSIWATHPFPCLIKLEDYPEVALDDVYRISDGILLPEHKNKWQNLDLNEPGTLELVKKMTIDEKIEHWQRVFQYAEDRGIEVYMFFWNVFTWYADGKYGITQEQDNPHTVKYIRKCASELLETYPLIAGIGVTAGENDDRYVFGDQSCEAFIFKTFGEGIMDVQEQQPDRKIRFIFRRHGTEESWVTEAFKDYTGGIVNASTKYSVAHTFSSRRPQEWENRIVGEGWLEKYKVWLNLRNDDIFMHRWGSADYVREFIKWMPHEHSPGFYLGSDGYVWGREFIAKNPEMAGRLEIDKHWYQFRLWGQLAYNIELGRDYWEATLQYRFPEVDARLLYDAWASTSEIVPQLNRSSWSPTDAAFSAEGCMHNAGFLSVDEYYFNRPAMPLNRIENPPDPQCLSVTEWAKAFLADEKVNGVSPLQVAENLDGFASTSLKALPELRAHIGDNLELKETLNDIESMAYLGRYYADKIRGAAKLAIFREGDRQAKQYLNEAVTHLEDAVEEWKAYADILTPQYKTQLLARTHLLDWNNTLEEVEKEVISVQNEGDYPEVRITNLKDGTRLAEGSDLRVEAGAKARHGIRKLKLYLNGQVIMAEEMTDDRYVWSGSSDELLQKMKPGMYQLEVKAEDNNGERNQQVIQIAVGNVSEKSAEGWRNEIHQVILNEGEQLMDGEIHNIPRLECFLTLTKEGMLALVRGTPDRREGQIWKTRGKANRPTPQPIPYRFYTLLENGQLVIYREKPDHPRLKIYETRSVSGPGPYKLGVTASKRLVVFREEGKKTEIVWRSPVQN